jgi:hypothetical protein
MEIETKDESLIKPSRMTDGRYAVLQETNGEEHESWLYFIRVEGNEENLNHLQKQLEDTDWYILEDLSTFDLELERTVSAQTAKEMTKLELNHCSFHRKFDGKLQKIDFDFRKKDGNETKICKVFDLLGYGQIEEYIDDEDLDDEDLISVSDDSDSDESDLDYSDDDHSGKSDSDDEKDTRKEELKEQLRDEINEKRKGRMPAALQKLKKL